MDMLAWYFAVGSAAGFCGGLVGIGGGIIVVPMLAMLFAAQHIPEPLVMPLALGTSLASIVFTSAASLRAHHRRGAVDWTLVAKFAPGLAIGAVVGSSVSTQFSSNALKLFFLAFAAIAATQMLLASQPAAARALPGKAPLFAAGGTIACVSSLVGCGGSSLAVPFMTWCSVPLRNAVGSAAAFSLPVALAGSAVYVLTGLGKTGLPPLALGYVHLPALAAIAIGSALAVPLGTAASHRLPVAVLKKCFALLLYAVAGRMLAGVM